MPAFDRIDEVQPSPQFGNSGPDGWGFTLWGSGANSEGVHRKLLEHFSAQHPASQLRLPAWQEREDLIEGTMLWNKKPIWVWFETVLNYTWLWSSDQFTSTDLRAAIMPFAESA